MIDSKQFIPEVYRKERDMQVFTTLLDIILSNNKYDIDSLGKLYDAEICPEQFLPLLAKTLNYEYNYSDPITVNRKILSMFFMMLRQKGSETGLKIASALSLTSLDIATNYNYEISKAENLDNDYEKAIKNLKITYDYENAVINIDYPNIYTLVRYLLDYVRPVGMTINLRSVVPVTVDDRTGILAQTTETVFPYNERYSEVNNATVNFSVAADNKAIEKINEDIDDISDDDIIDMNKGVL